MKKCHCNQDTIDSTALHRIVKAELIVSSTLPTTNTSPNTRIHAIINVKSVPARIHFLQQPINYQTIKGRIYKRRLCLSAHQYWMYAVSQILFDDFLCRFYRTSDKVFCKKGFFMRASIRCQRDNWSSEKHDNYICICKAYRYSWRRGFCSRRIKTQMLKKDSKYDI